IVAASRNDPIMRFDRAEHWCRIWKADLVDVGDAGHINAEAGFGPWPHGLEVLAGLCATVMPRLTD
ncbi:MAG: alpha/beta hydrolase, partial [Ancalomicrobiaceae bacterium]|nr:alpha/beta hydrolase [Ancalomicrobiaceae bacterium]